MASPIQREIAFKASLAGSLASGMGGGKGGQVAQPRANGRNDFDEGLALRGTLRTDRAGPSAGTGLAEPEGQGPSPRGRTP